MPSAKTITISLPLAMAKEMSELAKEEHRTLSELLREAFRQYRSQRQLKNLATKGKKQVKKLGLTEEDFGGPFEE
ncbi:MAG: ribbon-helix-helix domain-containing protein [Pseudomonadota bacterium]